jgi:hypothetical protein
MEDVIRAYTTDEWGIGGGAANGGSTQAHMLSIMIMIMILITIVMVPGALIALFMFIALAINLH